MPFVVFILSTGIAEGVRWLVNRRRERNLVTSGGLLAVLLVLMVPSLLNFQSILKRDIRTDRELTYMVIAQQIEAIVRSGDRLATPEIGTLGYYLPNVRVLDTQGLISPEAVPYRQEMLLSENTKDYQALWLTSGMIPPALINEQKPRFVVAPDKLAERLLQDQSFMGAYQEILGEPSSLMGGARIVVWQRVEGTD